MSTRRWLTLIFGIVLVGGAVTLYWLPRIVRQVAVARIHALAQRPVSIDAVSVNVFTGRLSVRGLHLAERDGSAPFADIQRLDIRVQLLPLLLGRLHLREVVVDDSTVRVVRLASNEFNFSDLIRSSGALELDVVVGHHR
jgi:uncharacterized protein involved in outer membrane biogenesis